MEVFARAGAGDPGSTGGRGFAAQAASGTGSGDGVGFAAVAVGAEGLEVLEGVVAALGDGGDAVGVESGGAAAGLAAVVSRLRVLRRARREGIFRGRLRGGPWCAGARLKARGLSRKR